MSSEAIVDGGLDVDDVEARIRHHGYCIFTATRYESTDDVRFRMCLDMIEAAQRGDDEAAAVIVVIVDSSSDDVHEALRLSSSRGGAIVRRQTLPGRKGAALREAAGIARSLPGIDPEITYLCWQEPEKVNMTGHWHEVIQSARRDGNVSSDGDSGAGDDGDYYNSSNDGIDVVIPYRNPIIFEETYPTEQFHSETYGNLYLDTLAMEEISKSNGGGDEGGDGSRNGNDRSQVRRWGYKPLMDARVRQYVRDSNNKKKRSPRVDWLFGPFAFKAAHVDLWTRYDRGEMYDAQLVPIVHAFRKGIKVGCTMVNYRAPASMKEQEENDLNCIDRRLRQLNELIPQVKDGWVANFYC